MPGLRKNLFYSILLVLANYVFPFLTYPYVSRVLGVTGIGACNFVDSIINYFILFSTLGLETLGVREIARNRDKKENLDKTFSNLFVISMMLTAVMLAVLVIVTLTVPVLTEHKEMMYFGAFKLVFNCLLVEWLYKGLEDFKLITVRTVAVKSLYVVTVFLFVRRAEDVAIYYLLSCLMVVANALVNIFLARKRVRLSFHGLALSRTFKSVLTLGLYTILTSMYTTLNVTYLGFVAGDTEVGYYSTATKLYGIVMALFSAFTGVMIPRMSGIVAQGDMEKFKSYFNRVIDLLLVLSLPLIVWMTAFAPDIIRLISGPGYEGAILPMIIITPLLFVIGYEQVLVLQTLLPLGKDKILLRNSTIGAVLGIGLNLMLVSRFLAIGSACVWLVCELVILVLSQIPVTKEIGIPFPYRRFLRSVVTYIPLVLLTYLCSRMGGNPVLRLGLSVGIVAAYVYVFQLVVEKRNLIKLFLHG